MLQCVAVCCSVLQCIPTHCNTDGSSLCQIMTVKKTPWIGQEACSGASIIECSACQCCSVLQRVAVSWSELQCVAVRCSVLQCVAVCCGVLPCVAACCSVFGFVDH